MLTTMKRSSIKKLVADVTGKHSWNWQGLLILMPLNITTSVLLAADFERPVTVFLATIANLASFVISALFFLLLQQTVFRNRATKNLPLIVVLLSGALLGAVKGSSTGYFMHALNMGDEFLQYLPARVLTTSLLGMWLIPAVALMFATREFYKLQRDALVAELVRIELEKQSEISPEYTGEKLVETSQELRALVDTVRKQVVKGQASATVNYKQTAEMFRQIIQNDLRPLSHKIWERENIRLNSFSFRDLSNLAITKYPFLLWGVIPVYLMAILPIEIAEDGLGHALIDGLLAVSLVALCYTIARRFVPKKISAALVYFVFVVILTANVIGNVHWLIYQNEINPGWIGSNLTNFIWLLEVTFAAAIAKAALASHEEVENALVRLMGRDAANQEILLNKRRIVNRELAQYLHGHVQNQLLASALRVEQAEASDDGDAITRELERVENLLVDTARGSFLTSSKSLKAELQETENQWSGLIGLSLKVEKNAEKLELDGDLVRDLARAVNEAISNATRHGFASQIDIEVASPNSSLLEIKVTDNGTGPRSGKPGLGSFLYESLAGKNWSVKPAVGGGSTLRLEITLG